MRHAMPLRATIGKISRFMQRTRFRKRGMSMSRFLRKYPNGKSPTSSKTGATFDRLMSAAPMRYIKQHKHQSK
jgi:hypothetical protein